MKRKKVAHCMQFFDKATREFQYLLDSHRFKISHKASRRNGEDCLLILKSPSCQIRIMKERGAIQADLGPVDAGENWPYSSIDIGVWYNLRLVIDFINDRAPKTDEEVRRFAEELMNMTVDEKLTDLANQLKPVINKVENFFDDSSLAETKKELDTYLGL